MLSWCRLERARRGTVAFGAAVADDDPAGATAAKQRSCPPSRNRSTLGSQQGRGQRLVDVSQHQDRMRLSSAPRSLSRPNDWLTRSNDLAA